MEGLKMDMLKDATLFDIETRMYVETLPQLERLFKMAGETFMLVPKYLCDITFCF